MASVIKAGNATDGVQVTSDNTGILELKTGTGAGTTAVTVDTSQNVGIGTSSPSTKLNVVGDNNNAYFQSSTGTAATYTRWSNSGGSAYIGLDNSTGSALGLAYALHVQSPTSLAFHINNSGTIAALLDSSGNLGLGVTPSAWNSIYKVIQADVGSIYSSSSYNNVGVGANVFYNAANSPRYIRSDFATLYGQDDGIHVWYTAPSGTAGNAISFTQVMAVEGGKSLALQGATSQSGTGITFPATQSASSDANTLDDYEEGTWTPGIAGGSGTTYTTRVGWYTKVGNLVTVGFDLVINAKGTISGNAQITGLPFTSGSSPSRAGGGFAVSNSLGTAYVSVTGFIDNGVTAIDIYTRTAASTSTTVPTGTAFFAANSQLIASFSYRV